jgi:hypothetical protein
MRARKAAVLLLPLLPAVANADSVEIRCPAVTASNPFHDWHVQDGEGWQSGYHNPVRIRCGGGIVTTENKLRCVYHLGDHGVHVYQVEKPAPDGADCRVSAANPCVFECTSPNLRPRLKDFLPQPLR